jgi:glucose/arabinose dehydrogenase
MRRNRSAHSSVMRDARPGLLVRLGWMTALASSALQALATGPADSKTWRSEKHSFTVTTVAAGLEHPWSLAFLPGGDMLVTEREGRLRLIRNGTLLPEPVKGVPKSVVRGQGGLLEVALHPQFAENRLVYLSYAAQGTGGVGTEVARGRLDGDTLNDVEVIFSVDMKTPGSAHYGGRLAFAPDGTLFITLGDRYSYMKEAQNPANHLGALIRVRDDGTVPPDNPFVGKPGIRPEIYSYGHRNMQGIAFHPVTGALWTHEHGPRGGDEVNIIKPGANYGWPAITYGIDYSGAIISDKTEAPGMEQPVIHWTPSIAPSGMAFYSGDKFPDWHGSLFVGALAGTHLRRLTLDGETVLSQEVLLSDLKERIRDVRQGPDGFLYVVTDDAYNGAVMRIEPAS